MMNIDTTKKFIFISIDRTMSRIALDTVYFIESDMQYIKIYTDEQIYKVIGNIKDFIKKLPEHFLLCHRSYIVNLHKINYIQDRVIALQNKDFKIPIGSVHKESFFNVINHFRLN